MKIAKENTATFIGDKIISTPNSIPDHNLTNVIRTELQLVIEDLHKDGKHIFLTSIEPGFAMLAAESIIEYAKTHKSIELHVVISFQGQELRYSEIDRLRYKRIYEAATNHIYICDEYCENAYQLTTEYMIAQSSEIVLFNREPNSEIEKIAGNKAWNMYEPFDEYFANHSPVKQFLQDYPNVTSFQYNLKGLVFRHGDWLIISAFEDIDGYLIEGDELRLVTNDGTKIRASLVLSEFHFDPLPIIMCSNSGLPS